MVWSIKAKHSGVLSCSLPLGTAPSPRVILENPSQKIPSYKLNGNPVAIICHNLSVSELHVFPDTGGCHWSMRLISSRHYFLCCPRCKWSHTANNNLCVSVKEHGCFNRSFLSLCSLVLLGWEVKSPASSLGSFLIEDQKISSASSSKIFFYLLKKWM